MARQNGAAAEAHTEVAEGYLVDLACVRKYPRGETLERARVHTRKCALMPHCVESGYALISEDGRINPLDPAATQLVVDAVRHSTRERGVRLRATRELQDGAMETRSVQEI